MVEFHWEPAGFLRVVVTGLWSDADADAYVAALSARISEVRRLHGVARALVDGRDSLVQPASVMAKMEDIQNLLITTPGDRAAYVVRSALGRLQAQRLSSTDRLQVFLSIDEATEWLLS
ncbi:hypothetical protein [Sphingobium sp. CAP-1]|uniref:hypothetical protein n=1 Tax=Sphingobium sp. CAP-1 TaxID=2676077 RepID=UPI0012BB2789|nr:hypothetical protein [Sphingobium sp. CAP-1]QGP81108.1 hypothetical protein GL174_18875 [Sphingobium sp. CAP-1]